ncbi:SH3-domain-containing protein [Dothidotthia symphoricarpi CBS 119687]|uniref:SH3-domain-containing protein n=1 Tax=Dothidotthia symphoricarpi CBS 119687 TaxID=1392245 RepID=A0A6A6AFI6_9PLEO|nr:SH3-domain-containing protein [Dothidotthia symphoricarpi CBS 119687]KAF2130550.1 SH3-domain-containing protein [Dothidotthia symphoricarpi CBS 119687]
MADGFKNAMINRALGDIKNNLQFLVEANVITAAQHDTATSQLPISAENSTRALPAAPVQQLPVQQLSQLNIKSEPTPPPEKKSEAIGYYANASHNAPPPAYPSAPTAPVGPPVLTYASAMYQYNAQDAGDLALMPNDQVAVTEYMNAEWWKGRNQRTGAEGIFPASYVRKDEKSMVPAGAPAPTNYGNMPLDVSNSAQQPHEPSKAEQTGKKFGKKLGNAAIFGAGATIGSNIVNSIF